MRRYAASRVTPASRHVPPAVAAGCAAFCSRGWSRSSATAKRGGGGAEARRRRPVRRRRALELLPQPAQLGRLVGRQQPEQPLGGPRLARALRGRHRRVGERGEREGVARVDLDDVVHEQHAHGPRGVGAGRRVLGEHHGHGGQVPRVLRAVLAAAAVGQPGAPGDGLEPVQGDDERELRVEPRRGGRGVAERRSADRRSGGPGGDAGRARGRGIRDHGPRYARRAGAARPPGARTRSSRRVGRRSRPRSDAAFTP
jgi:hypothetical protein